MISFNTAILAVAIVLTVLLALVNIFQIMMASKGVNPLEAEGKPKYIFLGIMAALLILLIAHIATVYAVGGAVGKNNALILVSGIIAIIFAIATAGTFLFKEKLGDRAKIAYFASLAVLWICIIVHVIGRVQIN